MEKQQFAELLGRFSKSSENEALNIMALKEYFPYSQVFHVLSARATKDHRFLEQKEALQLAAVYAADRAVLKQSMTDENLPVGKSLPPFLNITPGNITVSERFNPEVTDLDQGTVEFQTERIEAIEVAPARTEADITKARQTDAGTLNFQQRAHQLQAEAAAAAPDVVEQPLVAEVIAPLVPEPLIEANLPTPALAEVIPAAAASAVAPIIPPEMPVTTARADGAVAAESDGETNVADQVISDLERLNQLKQNFEALFEANKASILLRDAARTVGATPADEVNRLQQARQKRIAELVSSLDPELNGQFGELDYGTGGDKNILDEIKNNKQELEPESQKQKDQIQMIDDFINIQPNLAGKDKALNTSEDLSTIKTGEFSDKVVSETLVDILIKQGKKDKAVEVLKKLIWKFPQKKAYFAAQIEDLKK
ncbi:MAG: hypothetical protein QM762_19145 [Chryseolinea sp.]